MADRWVIYDGLSAVAEVEADNVGLVPLGEARTDLVELRNGDQLVGLVPLGRTSGVVQQPSYSTGAVQLSADDAAWLRTLVECPHFVQGAHRLYAKALLDPTQTQVPARPALGSG